MKVLFKFFIILSLPLSCHWREFKISENLTRQLKYRNYKKFKEELKSLAELRISLIDDAESKKLNLMSNYMSKWSSDLSVYNAFFINKDVYKMKTYWTNLQIRVPREYRELKELLKDLRILNEQKNISEENLKGHSSIFYGIYKYIYLFISYQNTYGDLRKYYRDFNIIFVKEALAEVTYILIYHFPYFYENLAYLFEEGDDYFQ